MVKTGNGPDLPCYLTGFLQVWLLNYCVVLIRLHGQLVLVYAGHWIYVVVFSAYLSWEKLFYFKMVYVGCDVGVIGPGNNSDFQYLKVKHDVFFETSITFP